jgi:hypothetical protein
MTSLVIVAAYIITQGRVGKITQASWETTGQTGRLCIFAGRVISWLLLPNNVPTCFANN